MKVFRLMGLRNKNSRVLSKKYFPKLFTNHIYCISFWWLLDGIYYGGDNHIKNYHGTEMKVQHQHKVGRWISQMSDHLKVADKSGFSLTPWPILNRTGKLIIEMRVSTFNEKKGDYSHAQTHQQRNNIITGY